MGLGRILWHLLFNTLRTGQELNRINREPPQKPKESAYISLFVFIVLILLVVSFFSVFGESFSEKKSEGASKAYPVYDPDP